MGLIAMSERDLQRIEILSKVIGGRMTTVSAAHVLEKPAFPTTPHSRPGRLTEICPIQRWQTPRHSPSGQNGTFLIPLPRSAFD